MEKINNMKILNNIKFLILKILIYKFQIFIFLKNYLYNIYINNNTFLSCLRSLT